MAPKRILIICRQPPYGSSYAKEALDVALATSVFEQTLALLFLGDGVCQLLGDQDSSAIGSKNISKQLSALPLYDVKEVYVDGHALEQRLISVDSLVLPAKLLDDRKIGDFINSFDTVLSF